MAQLHPYNIQKHSSLPLANINIVISTLLLELHRYLTVFQTVAALNTEVRDIQVSVQQLVEDLMGS